jgi:predicted 2-oxoglutarate/Fe(II)-dependent dioxygenase YbiX
LNPDQNLPPFQIVAGMKSFVSDAEIEWLLAEHGPRVAPSRLGPGGSDDNIRRSKATFLEPEQKNLWLYERLWQAACEANQNFFGVEITGMQEKVQLARYDATERGFYTWHTDFADLAPKRKLSMSVQLSSPEDYDGGDLELYFRDPPYQGDKSRGALIVFPSFLLHRVTPVTRGTRWSLVIWVSGPRWR